MRALIIVLLLLAALLGVAWQAETRVQSQARLQLRSIAAQLTGQGTLQYRSIEAHVWGSGTVTGLRFTPADDWRTSRGWPAGTVLEIGRLRFDHWQPGPAWPARLHLTLEDAHLLWDGGEPRAVTGTLDWQYDAATQAVQLAPALHVTGIAAVSGMLTLEVPHPGETKDIALTAAKLALRDEGFLRGLRARLAMQAGADPLAADTALANQLRDWMRGWSVEPDAGQQQVLSRFAADPTQITVELSPDNPVRFSQLPLYTPIDRGRVLGLHLSAP